MLITEPINCDDGTLVRILYLLGERVGWRKVAVPLDIDGWLGTPSNGVHLLVGVVVVHYMEVTMPAPETKAIQTVTGVSQPTSFEMLSNKGTLLSSMLCNALLDRGIH